MRFCLNHFNNLLRSMYIIRSATQCCIRRSCFSENLYAFNFYGKPHLVTLICSKHQILDNLIYADSAKRSEETAYSMKNI